MEIQGNIKQNEFLNLQGPQDGTVCAVSVLYNNSQPNSSVAVACLLPDLADMLALSLHVQKYCKLSNYFFACHPRFNYLQAKTKANSVGIGKQPAYWNGVNCAQNVHICCQGGLTAELPKKLPYALRWSSVKEIRFPLRNKFQQVSCPSCRSHLQISCCFQQGSCGMDL